METPKEFLLRKEATLVKTFGEATYMDEKVYFPDEVIEFIEEYAKAQKAEILKNFSLHSDGKVF
jgi:hypothetical protein